MGFRAFLTVGCLLLAGCGAIVYPSDGGRTSRAADGPPPKIRLVVVPIDGPPIPMARILADAVVQEFSASGVEATLGGYGQYVLKGKAETNVTDPNVPFITVIHWTLDDDTGKRIGIYSQGVEGSRMQWEYGDPVIVRNVGKGAATPILAMIRDDVLTVPVAAPVRTAVLVKPVLGAPSDGNQRLTRAITAGIQNAGYALTDDPSQAGYVLEGLVDVDPAQGGRQRVRIVWKVVTGDGREVGRAAQENTLPTESLEGPWDRVAVTVVASAFNSIEQMLEGAKRYQLENFPSGAPLPGRSGTAAPPPGGPTPRGPVPSTPGRAPPPPG